jgi:hypothetical protein
MSGVWRWEGVIRMKKEYTGEILYQEMMYEGCYRMVIKTDDDLLKAAQPGQFVHLKINQTGGPLLRRPFSIHRIDLAQKTISLLIRCCWERNHDHGHGSAGKKGGNIGTLWVLGFHCRTPNLIMLC